MNATFAACSPSRMRGRRLLKFGGDALLLLYER